MRATQLQTQQCRPRPATGALASNATAANRYDSIAAGRELVDRELPLGKIIKEKAHAGSLAQLPLSATGHSGSSALPASHVLAVNCVYERIDAERLREASWMPVLR